MSTTLHALRTEPPWAGVLRWFVLQAERLTPWIAGAALTAFGALGIAKAFYKPFWLDEIMGVLIAKTSVSSDIWAICKSGADNQPPFYHYAMRSSVRLFGNDALGMRIPSIVGYILFCLSLYWFVGRRTSRLYGLIAMLLAGTTGCWEYATEARPYALVLACTGIAAVCWQSIALDKSRRFMLFALGLSLACAFSLHYYSLLLLAPFLIAECFRSYKRRVLDFPVWLALTAPVLALIPYLPVIQATRVNSGIANPYYARPALYGSFLGYAFQFLAPSLVALIGIGCIYVLFRILVYSPQSQTRDGQISNREELIPELVLLFSLACVPILAIALSKFITHIFFNRYAIGSMFGIVALISIGMWLAFSGRKEPALSIALVLSAVLAHTAAGEMMQIRGERGHPIQAAILRRIPADALRNDLPIVAAGPNEFMDLSYYGDRALRKRLFYLSSEESAKRILGFTFLERMMIGSAPYFGTQVVDYNAFLNAHRSFYVFGSPQWWLYPQLIRDGAQLQMLQGGPVDSQGGYADLFFFGQMPSR